MILLERKKLKLHSFIVFLWDVEELTFLIKFLKIILCECHFFET